MIPNLSLQPNERVRVLANRSDQITETTWDPRIVHNEVVKPRRHRFEQPKEPFSSDGVGSKELMFACHIAQSLRMMSHTCNPVQFTVCRFTVCRFTV